jgi:hypothetical protein
LNCRLSTARFSISEGIIIRRNENGDVAIADDDGAVWF